MGYSHSGNFRTSSHFNALVLCIEKCTFALGRSVSTLDQRSFQRNIPLGCPAASAFAGTLVVARCNTGPGAQMRSCMGQTVFCEFVDFFSELFDPQKARKSPEILRFQDFLWLRRQDSKRSPKFFYVVKCAYTLHYFQNMALISPITPLFIIAHFLVREKIRENFLRKAS